MRWIIERIYPQTGIACRAHLWRISIQLCFFKWTHRGRGGRCIHKTHEIHVICSKTPKHGRAPSRYSFWFPPNMDRKKTSISKMPSRYILFITSLSSFFGFERFGTYSVRYIYSCGRWYLPIAISTQKIEFLVGLNRTCFGGGFYYI